MSRESGRAPILTAHTRDDQAETVLFRLARGSGLGGLAGMTRVTRLDGMLLIRPFLDVPKARVTVEAGETSRRKRVRVEGVPANTVLARLSGD